MINHDQPLQMHIEFDIANICCRVNVDATSHVPRLMSHWHVQGQRRGVDARQGLLCSDGNQKIHDDVQ